VSGEVVLVAPAGSVLERAVEKLDEVAAALPPFALVGGLAVMIRLGQAHRATVDLDAVTDDQQHFVEVLVDRGLERRGDSVMIEPDLKLDILDVSGGDPEYVPYRTHRFAFDTRDAVDVRVVTSGGAVSASATVPAARSSALVAMKLGISEGVGRQRDPNKVGSDVFDVVRLLQRFGPDVLADELRALADAFLVEAVARLATRHLVAEADRTAAAVVRSSVQGVERVPPEQLELLGAAFARRLGEGN
jgi:hypothetical protein